MGAVMDAKLHEALVASRVLERKLMAIAENLSLPPQERGRRIHELTAKHEGRGHSLSEAWVAAGRPEPLGYRYNQRADHAEWFDGWVEVESVVLDGEERGLTRERMEVMILKNQAPFDAEFEAEELGIIYRSNEPAPEQ